MRFRFGTFVYVVLITRTKPVDRDGVACRALINFDLFTISLWAGTFGKGRWNELLHELAHAWDYHRPVGECDEARAQDKANFAQEMRDQLDEQGGFDALDALMPEGEKLVTAADQGELTLVPAESFDVAEIEPPQPTLQQPDTVDEFTAQRWRTQHVRDRPCCGTWVYDRNIWTSPVHWLDKHGTITVCGHVVDRGCYCASCGVLSLWIELIDPFKALPAGPIDAAEQISRRSDPQRVDQFLADHPECLDISDAA